MMTDNEIFLLLYDGIVDREQPKTIEGVESLQDRIEGILDNVLDDYKSELERSK